MEKNGAARHDLLARGQAGENFDHAVTGSSRADVSQTQSIAVSGYPDAGPIPFVHDRLLWHRRRHRRLTGDDAEIRKHPGFERAVQIFDIGPDEKAVRILIDRWRHPGDLRFQDTAGQG